MPIQNANIKASINAQSADATGKNVNDPLKMNKIKGQINNFSNNENPTDQQIENFTNKLVSENSNNSKTLDEITGHLEKLQSGEKPNSPKSRLFNKIKNSFKFGIKRAAMKQKGGLSASDLISKLKPGTKMNFGSGLKGVFKGTLKGGAMFALNNGENILVNFDKFFNNEQSGATTALNVGKDFADTVGTMAITELAKKGAIKLIGKAAVKTIGLSTVGKIAGRAIPIIGTAMLINDAVGIIDTAVTLSSWDRDSISDIRGEDTINEDGSKHTGKSERKGIDTTDIKSNICTADIETMLLLANLGLIDLETDGTDSSQDNNTFQINDNHDIYDNNTPMSTNTSDTQMQSANLEGRENNMKNLIKNAKEGDIMPLLENLRFNPDNKGLFKSFLSGGIENYNSNDYKLNGKPVPKTKSGFLSPNDLGNLVKLSNKADKYSQKPDDGAPSLEISKNIGNITTKNNQNATENTTIASNITNNQNKSNVQQYNSILPKPSKLGFKTIIK